VNGLQLNYGHISVSTNGYKKIASYFSVYFSIVLSQPFTQLPWNPTYYTNELASRWYGTNGMQSSALIHTYTGNETSPTSLVVEHDNEIVFLKKDKLQFLQFVLICDKTKNIQSAYVNGKVLTDEPTEPMTGMLTEYWSPEGSAPLTDFVQFGSPSGPFIGALYNINVFQGKLSSQDIYALTAPPTNVVISVYPRPNRAPTSAFYFISSYPPQWYYYEQLNLSFDNVKWIKSKSSGAMTVNGLITDWYLQLAMTLGKLGSLGSSAEIDEYKSFYTRCFFKDDLLYPYPVIDLPRM
jgi:hypothetical protein